MTARRVLLIIGGGIAAYKVLTLIRDLGRRGIAVTPVLTEAGAEFVTPLSVSALAGEVVHDALFDLTREAEMGHIQLSRSADLVVVAPATANLMAKMAAGLADDLASTLLLATDKKVLLAPAMNVRMWQHTATQRNIETLRADGAQMVGPDEGDMACGEYGPGRMAEPAEILTAIERMLDARTLPASPSRPAPLRLPPEAVIRRQPLAGRHVIVTSGPTQEPIDPVRYISNRSSGAQGSAIAAALRDLGARVSFVTGPAETPPPAGVDVIRVSTADQMREAVEAALPADAAVMAAAVADWKVANAAGSKMKKDASGAAPALEFTENPDILAWVSQLTDGRPQLVVGFAAETDQLIDNASAKRRRKGCDWIVANDVGEGTGTFGGAENTVTLITETGNESWPKMRKDQVAAKLAGRIAEALS
ncbi:MAG: bifunctional phosphopantothenoylcysteine decarboxylase/phosphopantothenate synthase [Paracoccus sp. (in: a-proteobacteria)]|nr:bifunctional phosphopantothenoylcysteine decarboxylase/phosphopantothenate synthase [Paracoccus sp. (in: a-proteobacteria)]